MKDQKFIELLNLYLDHQISPAEAAELEAEIQRNPARRRVYREYCQMQKACVMLAEDFRTQAPVPQTGKVESFPPRRRALPALYAAGLTLAAACIAFVVMVNRAGTPASVNPALAPAAVAQNEPAARPLLTMPASERRSAELQTVFNAQAVVAQLAELPEAELVAKADSERLDWLNQVQMTPLQFETLRYDTPTVNSKESRTFHSRRPFQSAVEMTAYQFQK